MTATTHNPAPAARAHPRRSGPPLPAPALAWAALTVAGAALYRGAGPASAPATDLAALRDAPLLATLSTTLLVASAAPLAVWVAAMHQRMHALGVRVAGPTIGLVGGIAAAVALAVSGLASWTAEAVAATPSADAGTVHAFTVLSFGAGGPLFAVAVGLLVAGFAVPALILRLLPRWLAIAGLVVAGFGALGVLVLLVPVLAPVLPVARFGGLLWIVAASFALPRTRRRAGA